MKYFTTAYNWTRDTFFTWRALVTYLIIIAIWGMYAVGVQHGRTIEARHAEINGAHMVLASTFIDEGKEVPKDLNVFISQKHAEVSPWSWWQVGYVLLFFLIFGFITFLRMMLGAWTEKCVDQEQTIRILKTLIKDGIKE